MRGIDIACFPFTSLIFLQDSAFLLGFLILVKFLAVWGDAKWR